MLLSHYGTRGEDEKVTEAVAEAVTFSIWIDRKSNKLVAPNF